MGQVDALIWMETDNTFMPKGAGTTGTGIIIRDYLLTVPSATQHDIWAKVKETCIANEWKYPAFDHFCKYFWKVRKLELVVEDHREPLEFYGGQLSGTPRVSNFIKERIFFKLNKKKASSSAWGNPQRALYG